MKQPHNCRIGIDVMGNENSPAELIQTIQSLLLPENIHLTCIGPKFSPRSLNITSHEATQEILLHENPILGIKSKKNASILQGLRLLKEQKIDTFITAGNTGALVLGSKIILSLLPKIRRPALLGHLPSKKNEILILDLGANIEFTPEHLLQFAYLGASYASAILGIHKPKVGLLNIGEEPLKGTSLIKKTYSILRSHQTESFTFAGNVEGHAVFNSKIDVLITDGFTGNIFLKSAESTLNFLHDKLDNFFQNISQSDLRSKLHEALDFRKFSAATLLGVSGHIMKIHSHSSKEVFLEGIKTAIVKNQNLHHRKFIQSFTQKYLQDKTTSLF